MKKTTILILLSCFLPLCAIAQPWNQLGNSIEGEASGDQSGLALSLDEEGNTIAIGAHFNDGNGSNSGHIRVMDWDGTSWTQRGLDIDGMAAGDSFGFKVCMSGDGNILAGGAQFNGTNGYQSGHARIFSWEGGQWTQMGSDLNGTAVEDYFGQSVRLSYDGHTVAVGGAGYTGSELFEGVIRVYNWNGTDWEQMGADIVGGEYLGQMRDCDLSADGTTLITGTWASDANGEDAGQVRVFEWDGLSWVQKGDNLNGDNAQDNFGTSTRISADGNIIAAGAPFGDGDAIGENTGYVKVFEWDGTNWVQSGSNIYGEGSEDLSAFNIGLSSDGSKLIIGAIHNDGNGVNSGHARIYKFENSNWVQEGDDINGEAAVDWAGFDVDINDAGNVVAVGARFHNDSGHVRVFGDIVSSISKPSSFYIGEIFPNPSSGEINIKLEKESNTTIKVFGVDGRILYRKENILSTLHQFNLEMLPGLYIVEISSNGITQRVKLIKQ